MTPPADLANEIDRIVEAYDAATLPELPQHGRATVSFADLCAGWDRFADLVNAIGVALVKPLAEDAPEALRRAGELVDDDAFRLSYRLSHVGDALARRLV
jgi:hypothetical protein